MARAKHSYRLFFACELNAELKTRLLEYQRRFDSLVATPVAAENFHITLSFLGETEEKLLEAMLDQVAPPQFANFDVTIHQPQFWPKPKVIALSLDDPNGGLGVLKKQLESQIAHLGVRHYERREFRPHITLFRQVEQLDGEFPPFNATLSVDSVSLMLSQSGRNGVTYQALANWPLKFLSVKQQLLGRTS